MDQDLLELEILMSNDTISECSDKIQKYDKAVKRNALLLLVLGVLVLASAIGGGIYAKFEDGKWYFILLFAFLGGLAGFIVSGVFLFLAKPFLHAGRKKLLKKLPEIEDNYVAILEAKCSLLEYYLKNAIAENPWKRTDRPKKLPSISQIFEDWVREQNGILEYTCNIRYLELTEQKYIEWAWILYAVAVAVLCVAFVIAIHVFIGVLIVMLVGLAIYFGMLDGINDTSRSYKNDDADFNGTGIFDVIFHFITGPMNEKVSEINQELDLQRSILDSYKSGSDEHLNLLIEYYFPNMDKELIDILKYSEDHK